jgi:hypothetical protein
MAGQRRAEVVPHPAVVPAAYHDEYGTLRALGDDGVPQPGDLS